MYGFQGMVYTLEQWGVIDVILPFILIFTVVFAILEQTKVLGGKDKAKNKKYSMMIALVMAFSVIVPHITGSYYYGFDAVEIINKALPQIGLLLVAIVMMLLTIGLWTGKKADGSKGPGIWFTLISGAIVVGIFIASLGLWQVPYWLMWILRSDILSIVVAILVFGFIIRWISGDSDTKEKAAAKRERNKARQKAWEGFLGGSSDDD